MKTRPSTPYTTKLSATQRGDVSVILDKYNSLAIPIAPTYEFSTPYNKELDILERKKGCRAPGSVESVQDELHALEKTTLQSWYTSHLRQTGRSADVASTNWSELLDTWKQYLSELDSMERTRSGVSSVFDEHK